MNQDRPLHDKQAPEDISGLIDDRKEKEMVHKTHPEPINSKQAQNQEGPVLCMPEQENN
jgi:hypothetical protein